MPNIHPPKRLVSSKLISLAAAQPQAFAALCEQDYQTRIHTLAQAVLARGCSIVMLSGPSATGKTTSARKLCAALQAAGVPSTVLSLDDFFVGEGRYPKHADGTDDYESLHALDLPVLHRCLRELYEQGQCEAPVFDFLTQLPSGTQHIDCCGGVVVVEGLHALNPVLTEELPPQAVFRVYAGLREEYAAPDGRRCLATRDIRLARRIVRDWLFRGHGAEFTFAVWPHVCEGESRFIRPYKPEADYLLDTTHSYEVCLWNGILAGMHCDTPADAERLDALQQKFACFAPMAPALVPPDSMLREFVGPKTP